MNTNAHETTRGFSLTESAKLRQETPRIVGAMSWYGASGGQGRDPTAGFIELRLREAERLQAVALVTNAITAHQHRTPPVIGPSETYEGSARFTG